LKGFGKGRKRIITFKHMGWCLNFVVYEEHEYYLNKKGKIMKYGILWKIKHYAAGVKIYIDFLVA
jgi:hypothetical protein